MSKKKFKDRFIGKLLLGSPVVKTLVKSLPFGVGDLIGNVIDNTEDKNHVGITLSGSQQGSISKEEMLPKIIKMAIYAVLVYLALKGTLTWDDAEQAKSFIGN